MCLLDYEPELYISLLGSEGLTVGVTRKWAGVDSAWEQKKLEARKMPVKCGDSHLSGARFVVPLYGLEGTFLTLPRSYFWRILSTHFL